MEITKRSNNYVAILIFLYSLSTFWFFAPIFINLDIIKVVSFGIVIASFVAVLPEMFLKKDIYSRYRKPMRYIVLVALLSVINGNILHDQDFLLGLRSMLELIPFSFFFILYKFKVTVKELEKIITYITILYLFLFFVALAVAPMVIFDASGSGGEEVGINTGRGVARVKVLGICFAYLSLFIAINRWNIQQKWYNLVYIGFLYLVILLNVSRQHIVFSVVLGILMITQKVKWVYKVPIILLSLGIINYVIENVAFVQNLIALSEDQIEDEGDQNIRIRAFNYYMFEYNHNTYADFFGNGIPNLSGKWGTQIEYIKQTLGYVPSDVGYAKLFFYTGILGFIVFGYLIIKMFRQKIPPTIQYCKYYLAFLVFTNIASHSFFTDTITFVFIIYIMEYTYRSSLTNKVKPNMA